MTTPADAAREWLEVRRFRNISHDAKSLTALIEAREREAYAEAIDEAVRLCNNAELIEFADVMSHSHRTLLANRLAREIAALRPGSRTTRR